MIRPICASFPRCTPRRGKPARIPHHRKHRRSPVECHILRRGWKRKGRGERARCADKDGKKGRARKKEREGGTKKRGKRNDGGMGRDGERRRGVQARPATWGMKKVENRYRQKRIFSPRISRFFSPPPRLFLRVFFRCVPRTYRGYVYTTERRRISAYDSEYRSLNARRD